MTINTQKLRALHRQITPLPWSTAGEAFDNDGQPETVIQAMGGRAAVAVTLDFGKNNPGMRQANAEYVVTACNAVPGLLDHIAAQAAQLAAYPADWRGDSSLETWFPLTAEQLKAQTAEIARLREALGAYANPKNWETDEHGWARQWLEPDSTSRRSYDGTELARAALAQEGS